MAQTRSTASRTNGAATSRKGASSNGSAPSRKRSPSSRSSGSRSKSSGSARSQDVKGDSLSERVKTSAIAGGAAAAGLAGGLMLARRGKVLGMRVPGSGSASVAKNLAEAAKQVGGFGERVGDLANEIRLVREGVAHNQKRSPVEVVLEGLTSRRGSKS